MNVRPYKIETYTFYWTPFSQNSFLEVYLLNIIPERQEKINKIKKFTNNETDHGGVKNPTDY